MLTGENQLTGANLDIAAERREFAIDANAELTVGQPHHILRHPDMPPEAFADMWKTISSGYPWRSVVCNRAKDGSPYWVDTVIAPFFDDAGNIEKYISIRTDITAAKRTQTALAAERMDDAGLATLRKLVADKATSAGHAAARATTKTDAVVAPTGLAAARARR